MYGVLLISLRLCRFLKLLSFQSIGAEITPSTSGSQTLCVHLSPFFCNMTAEDLNFCEYTYSSKANPCQYFTKYIFFPHSLSLVMTVELIYAEVIKTSWFKNTTIIVTNIAHLPNSNCASSLHVSFCHKRSYSIFCNYNMCELTGVCLKAVFASSNKIIKFHQY